MAWTKTLDDYCGRTLNGEHSLQASLYHHLRGCLPSGFRVFCEAVVHFGPNMATDAGKGKAVVDLLVEHESKVIGAIEIKFTPRGKPADEDIYKDLISLSTLTSRRAYADRVLIEMPRFRSASNESLTLSILPQRKLIFATVRTMLVISTRRVFGAMIGVRILAIGQVAPSFLPTSELLWQRRLWNQALNLYSSALRSND